MGILSGVERSCHSDISIAIVIFFSLFLSVCGVYLNFGRFLCLKNHKKFGKIVLHFIVHEFLLDFVIKSDFLVNILQEKTTMSVAYNQPPKNQAPPPPPPAQIQKILDENCGLIQTIQDYQNMGKANECMSFHQALHKNLVWLAQLAGDPQQPISQILPVR